MRPRARQAAEAFASTSASPSTSRPVDVLMLRCGSTSATSTPPALNPHDPRPAPAVKYEVGYCARAAPRATATYACTQRMS